MKKPRSRRKPTKPPPAGVRPSRRGQLQRDLQYKVVELSTVDEGSLERTFNEWTARGWNLDGVQFAMRESSKRPAMAFVFFTREGPPAVRALDEARDRLARIAGVPPLAPSAAVELFATEAPLPPGGAAAGGSAPGGAGVEASLDEADDEDASPLGPDENGAIRWVELPPGPPEGQEGD